MYDHPSAAELIAAARMQIERNLLPSITDPRLRFQSLVAANVLAIAGRELAEGDMYLARAWQRMAGLLEDSIGAQPVGAELHEAVLAQNRALCAAIQAGEFDADPRRGALLAHLRHTAEAELAVANPRFLERIRMENRE